MTGVSERYLGGAYAAANPEWHAQDSPYKAGYVVRLLDRQGLRPRSILDLGTGVGEIPHCWRTATKKPASTRTT